MCKKIEHTLYTRLAEYVWVDPARARRPAVDATTYSGEHRILLRGDDSDEQ